MGPEKDFYNTINSSTTTEFKDRGSRFIAYAFPIGSVDEFKKRLKEIKHEHPKATHHCFAYRLGFDDDKFRIGDDGEPSGTAGRPILGQIDSKMLTNLAVVVVRYFGGTLLGVPGLINAYKSSAAMVLQLTPIVKKPVEVLYHLQFDYTRMNEVMVLIRKFECSIHKQETLLFCTLEIGIPKANLEICVTMLREIRGLELVPL